MSALKLFLNVDPSIGRVDCSLLSDQTLMEMLIDGFDDETKQEYQDKDGMYLDACRWSCVTCDDDQGVIQIDIESYDVKGSLELCYAPPNVKEIYIRSVYKSKITGSVDLT